MKKYSILICGAGVAILSYTQINMHAPTNTELINARIPRFVKTEKRAGQFKRDSIGSILNSADHNQLTPSVR
ncbi:MAG: hypothetical protein JSU09_14235 [Bacteroidetes bacterium]|nr:hypothetical protein [Bacteroidota bacterium]